ncbi:MAG TPA: PSD1 and planctomycete cytochrome C domain-containing protein [Pirellulales bacterium]|jgi:mono/diheme cytochrome c family protein
MARWASSLAVVLFLWGTLPLCAAENNVDFQRDILPVFQDHCYQCHDGRKQTSGFRLDVRSCAMHGGDSGETAIVPGKSAESELLKRLTSTDADEVMPPKDKSKPLSADEIATVKRWIDSGATWPDKLANEDRLKKNHWAFIPPKRPALPEVKNQAWVRTPIDQFILAKLEAEGLEPSAEADRATLLRRLSLDLTGLPPSIEELDAFVSDTSADAYHHAVERLLESPHYGENWGRQWLDAARYADSDGYEKDKPRFVWFYRDWVVNALNRDLPYDQFIIRQIAGDQLPGATQDDRVATGFLRNSMVNEEGGIDPEQFRMEAMFDRMDTIGKSILGVTIQCAQCHNHKYDPLTQEEYYRLFAFINDSHESNIAVFSPEEQMKRAELYRKMSEIEADLKHRQPDWHEKMAKWEESVKGDQPAWTPIEIEPDDTAANGQKFILQSDGSYLSQGYVNTKNRFKFTVHTQAKTINAFRLELLTDPNLPLGGPGRSIYGTAALSEFEIETAPESDPKKIEKHKFSGASADFNPPETEVPPMYNDRSNRRRVIGPASYAVDGNTTTAWATDTDPARRNQPRKAVFNLEKPIELTEGTVLTLYLNESHGGWNGDDNQTHHIGRFRISVTAEKDAVADPLPAAVREILSIPAAERTPKQTAAVFSYWRTTEPTWKDANDQIELLWKQFPEGSSQLVLQSRAGGRETHLLQRGDFLKPDRVVPPGVPSFLNPLPDDAPPTRLTFAKWLVDRNSPTTARAIVNRVWQAYFGIGLVATSEDLGTRCETPSHPELLDWLAVEFMDSGWSLKHLHRLIVNSATYRQSSHITPALLEKDPYNRLLAHGPRFRATAETVHDVALAASGLINLKVGGAPVYPPIPEFLLKPPVSFGQKSWPTSTGEDCYRRAMYIFHFRTAMYPELQTFDGPTADFSCVRRARSNTPLQALASLNEPLMMECSQSFARKILEEGGTTDASRMSYAFRRCVSRSPTEVELAELTKFYTKQKERFASGWVNSWQWSSIEAAKAEAAKANPSGADAAKSNSTKADSVKPEVAKTDSAESETVKAESSKTETVKADGATAEPKTAKAESATSAPARPPFNPRFARGNAEAKSNELTLSPPEVPKGSTPTELAAWTTVARLLLNLDETISVE